jgi:hypothetical protein
VPPCQGGCREFESLLPLHDIGTARERGFYFHVDTLGEYASHTV